MADDRGSVLTLVGDFMDNSNTFLELKPHIVNRTSHPIRAMPDLHLLNSYQISTWEKRLLPFITFILGFARELGLFNKVESDRLSSKYVGKVLIRDWLPKKGFLMEESITQVTEKNAVVRDWSLRTQKEKGDSLKEGYIFDLLGHKQWDSDTRGIFIERYEGIAHLIAINVDEQLIQAMVRFWNPAYQCFTFNQEDMTSTIEEYATLLRVDNNHPDTLKRVNLFALAIYELIFFPKVLGHIEVAVVDFFEKLRQGINPVPTILAETFRSLSSCRRKGEERFIGCALLLNAWIFSHFCKVERTHFHMFSKTFTLLEAYLEKDWPKDVTEQHWVLVFQNLRAEDITWREPWIRPSILLYKCGNQDWVPLLKLWGGVGYAPLMVQRQFASRQFIPATSGLAQSEFAFTGEGYMKKVRDATNSWREIYLMELALYADTITQDYDIWRQRRVKNQLNPPTDYASQNLFSEEMPSTLEIARHKFECKKVKLLRDISSLQEENYQLKIDVQIEKSRTEKVQKEAEITRKDLRDLHLENKKLQGTIRNSGLGKSSAEWKEELSNIKDLENTLQAHQQHLDDLLRALEEKTYQYDRNIRAYEIVLQEKDMYIGSLVNEICKAAVQIVQYRMKKKLSVANPLQVKN
ncbi:hypothetical protein Gotri_019043 [Gossypium trilobum]|uniref:DUF7745 domain-containing protein n=1 Tax=Gossypium trilobum TaxID=34281 RepID=A0A7J9EC37_9ROSI|nr:hypothetical protein [Gossypium trilobum]